MEEHDDIKTPFSYYTIYQNYQSFITLDLKTPLMFYNLIKIRC